ncbi:glyoxalase/bleomycin resistance/dioxygenase family protein [Caproiciproducens galactitolivorans]|uniref:Glyoxalase/bleomycin resistance/dioxygenase family protein n=1 Tax=Caproiciproducens galactitolivorans TaxID=642589 RepID=A0ABT4BV76_9FIRM|nr:glyoxalase/bleomycin resistance/dioxygenase family protein [Caproiciproducens galactitolivorans]MCY1714786.1 glyoxalase/bleomycin resistance/dioxygenase family protein [Caproiciproducens galactitolivorans]
MEFKLALLAVKDVEVSKKFYSDLFEQKVVLDLGWNVTFSGGFAIQQNFAWLTDLSEEDVIEKSNNMELYFEVDDFDKFLGKLTSHPEVEYVHPPRKHEWQQRVVRIYDPDHHMIEIGESMAVIARRYLKEGLTAEETAKIIQHPIEFVKMVQASL